MSKRDFAKFKKHNMQNSKIKKVQTGNRHRLGSLQRGRNGTDESRALAGVSLRGLSAEEDIAGDSAVAQGRCRAADCGASRGRGFAAIRAGQLP